ncbi:hypothetical protein KGQ20_02460 [Catenulispora sp. NF23]|uniref:Transposase IS701-like DDE domain-containing protein n=1 Tax=Catenulispora pinistramenti TaxID=2705254 RepID=A0ABS5L537_9ACTN|nr:hypothetical protein [Catenulispora pinistramenti]MBS2553453.1 hypothetical protein [Catenulispora pinistramenti]
MLVANSRTAPHADGVPIIDDSGDRKSGHATDYVARQYLGSHGETRGRHRGSHDLLGRRPAQPAQSQIMRTRRPWAGARG